MRLVAILLLVLTGPAAAQSDTTAAAPPGPVYVITPAAAPPGRYRSPTTGYLLGWLAPGGGHFYAGESGTGMILVGARLAGTALVLPALFAQAACPLVVPDGSCEPNRQAEMALLWGGMLVVGSAVYSIVDGGRAVERANVRNGHERTRRVAVGVAPAGALGADLRVRVRL